MDAVVLIFMNQFLNKREKQYNSTAQDPEVYDQTLEMPDFLAKGVGEFNNKYCIRAHIPSVLLVSLLAMCQTTILNLEVTLRGWRDGRGQYHQVCQTMLQ